MLFSLHIIYDYIILDDNVLNIVNKNIGTEKKKMTGGKKNNNFVLAYVCVRYNRYSIKTHIYKTKQKYYCNSRETNTSVLSIFISMGSFHEIIPF